MKIATSSTAFAGALREGTLTHLEWLDLCANELEADGVVFAAGDLPRDDAEYLAQLKKLAADLCLTVAALEADAVLSSETERWLNVAAALGAPLVIARAPVARDDSAAWSAFVDGVREAAGAAKRRNITLALRNAPQTLCASVADSKRLAKDVDSAWLRYALASADFGSTDDARSLLAKTAIATHRISNLRTFATEADGEAEQLVMTLARFRGFVVLEHDASDVRAHYHDAVERFASVRERALANSAQSLN